MERMHVTYEQALHEPAFIVNQAFLIWDLDSKRAKFDSGSSNN